MHLSGTISIARHLKKNNYVRQADDLFDFLARNSNKWVELEISLETRSGGGKESPREDRELVEKVTQRVQSTTEGRGERSALSWLSREW